MQISSARPAKSTNVRLSVRALQATFRTLGATSPDLAARLAARMWGRPPRARQRDDQRARLAAAQRFHADLDGTPVAAYAWGSGPAILLVHGWGGHAGQLTPLVEPLQAAGFRTIAFDAPAHGATPGRETNLIQFARAIDLVSRLAGGVTGIAAHSLGAAASAWAMHEHGLQPRRAVFLAPASDMTDASQRFARFLNISAPVRDRMQRRFEERLGLTWDRFNVPVVAPSMSAKLLVMHDDGDREVPVHEGAAIAAAWPGAVLQRTSGLGHNRILRDPGVIGQATTFFTQGHPPATSNHPVTTSQMLR